MFNDNDRGQVGIGTLIVFIAMVLVAAIAAGVLINTAGFLQSQAQATGEESAEQVTDRVQVTSTVGLTDDDGDAIRALNVTVFKSPGSGDIDLENAIVEVFVSGSSDTLDFGESLADADFDNDPNFNFDSGETDPDSNFAAGLIGDEENTVLSNQSDRGQITIVLGDEDGTGGAAEELAEGGTLELVITTASGAVTEVTRTAPESLDEESSVRL